VAHENLRIDSLVAKEFRLPVIPTEWLPSLGPQEFADRHDLNCGSRRHSSFPVPVSWHVSTVELELSSFRLGN
jgi:hypothetical protein